MRFLIIGGSNAGISAALRAHEINPDAEISLFLADQFPNYSICGLPFFLSGETPDWKRLAHRTEFDGIHIRRSSPVEKIDVQEKTISVQIPSGTVEQVPYDKLVIATGAVPVKPQFEGSTLPGVFELHTMDDSFQVKARIEAHGATSAIIVGVGYIGVEMADALIAGHWKSEVSKRIDVFATGLFHGMTVDALNHLDLSYTPPFSSPWDPIQMSAQEWTRQYKPLRRNANE